MRKIITILAVAMLAACTPAKTTEAIDSAAAPAALDTLVVDTAAKGPLDTKK